MFQIPIWVYQLCVTRFGPRSQEYTILQNGVISRDERGVEFVEILCDEDSAQLIREKILDVCPDAAAEVRERRENSSA
jgi:hypothetical protein